MSLAQKLQIRKGTSLSVLHAQAGQLDTAVEATDGIAGVRWYEIRDPGIAPTVFQQGTFAPSDGVHRWMGSIAMDRQGNMALGYSVSNHFSAIWRFARP